MLKKPEACKGCPMYGDGFGFVPDVVAPTGTTYILMSHPTDADERKGLPLQGDGGRALVMKLLPLANLALGDSVGVGHMIRCRHQVGGKGKVRRVNTLPTDVDYADSVAHCRVHDAIPDSVTLVVTVGEVPWSLYSNGKLHEWRGYMSDDYRP